MFEMNLNKSATLTSKINHNKNSSKISSCRDKSFSEEHHYHSEKIEEIYSHFWKQKTKNLKCTFQSKFSFTLPVLSDGITISSFLHRKKHKRIKLKSRRSIKIVKLLIAQISTIHDQLNCILGKNKCLQ